MKLFELIHEDGILGTRLTTKELDFLLDLVKDEQMSQSELASRVNDVLVDYPRNKNSLKSAAPRMYTIVHGELPLDMEDRSGWFSQTPSTMVRYAEEKGYDVSANLHAAQVDAKERSERAARKLTKDQALQTMRDFYIANKDMLDGEAVKADRNNIVAKLMKGEGEDVAFYHHFTESAYLDTVKTKLHTFKQRISQLNERALTRDKFYEIGDLLNNAIGMYSAARRGLGITNKLKDPAEKKMHRSRIMGNLNRLRATVQRIEQSF